MRCGSQRLHCQHKLDGESKVLVEITRRGKTAEGPPSLAISAIHDANTSGRDLNDAFDARNMYADAI